MELEEKEKAEKKKRGPKPSSVRFKEVLLWFWLCFFSIVFTKKKKKDLETVSFSDCLGKVISKII